MVYRAKGIRFLGIAQLVIGGLMIILAIASLASLHHWTSYVASGVWTGLWVGLIGLFAFLGARSDDRPNKCLIGTMIGFAVTGCVLSGVMLIIYAFALAQFAQYLRCLHYIDHRPSYGNTYYHCYYGIYWSYSYAQTGAAISSLLLILAVVEFFVALASSICGCNACCCTTPSVQATHQAISYVQQPNGNILILAPHGGGPTGTAFQAINTYPGQVLPVIQSGPTQTLVASTQGIFQPVQTAQQGQPARQGQPAQLAQSAQPCQVYPANTQVAVAGAFCVQQPCEAFQKPETKQKDMPPAYDSQE